MTGYDKTHFENIQKFLSKAVAGNASSDVGVKWFPAYGCAILFHSSLGQRSDYLSISVIGLDDHQCEIHSGATAYEFSSVAKSHCVLHVGELSSDVKEQFEKRFYELLDKTKQRKGEERTAARGKQGHQKTPAFIQAISIQALQCIGCDDGCDCQDVLPSGGLTDVGRHTGGEPRDTHYALVKSVCQWLLDQDYHSRFPDEDLANASFDAFLMHFHCYVMERTLPSIREIDCAGVTLAADERIDYLWTILKEMVFLAAKLSDDGHHTDHMYSKMRAFKKIIYDSLQKWHQTHRNENTVEITNGPYRTPNALIPDFIPPQMVDELCPMEVMNIIQENLGIVSLLPSGGIKIAADWVFQVKENYFQSSEKLFTYLREIENVFWSISKTYLHDVPIPLKDLDSMVTLIDHYREALAKVIQEKSVKALVIRMRSTELLLVWVGYCCTFNAVKHKHSDIMSGFGVALRFTDLRHISLQDQEHIEVLQRVASFLERHSITNMDLFSTRSPQNWNAPTFLFAAKFGAKHLSLKLQTEMSDAEERVAKHWAEVRRKQTLARRLREKLQDLENRLEEERSKRYVSRLCKILRNKKIEIEIEIEKAEAAPPAVIQPLPRSTDKAYKVLFFLYMSKEVQHLSRLSFLSQQLLVPKPWIFHCEGRDGTDKVDVHESIKVTTKDIPWKRHYINHRTTRIHLDFNQKVSVSMHKPAPNKIGPSHVDHFYSQEDGIWYPDENDIKMMWYGGSPQDKHCRPFDPFSITDQFTCRYLSPLLLFCLKSLLLQFL